MVESRSESEAALLRRVGMNARLARVEQGLSQEAAAQAAGLHRTHISLIERGEANLTVINLARLAEGLGVELTALVAGARGARGQ